MLWQYDNCGTVSYPYHLYQSECESNHKSAHALINDYDNAICNSKTGWVYNDIRPGGRCCLGECGRGPPPPGPAPAGPGSAAHTAAGMGSAGSGSIQCA